MSSNGAETTVVAAKKPKSKKLKPARKQVKPGDVEKKETPQTGKEYNIWYNKWAGGDREDSYSNKTKSQTRCNIKLDSGLTRANTTGMRYCCLFFARGCCPYGWECEYLHTLPDPANALPDSSKDCFARDKFADYRDDMGGVGSFNRQNRTLYVGRIKETGTGLETEEVVKRHFKEFGEIERDDSETGWAVKVLQYRSVAFVTYKSELHAQFAKEAMSLSKVNEKHRLEEMGQAAIREKMDPRVVDAMRTIRALEDGDVLDEDGNVIQRDEEAARGAKRRKLDVDDQMSTPPPQAELSRSLGLLSADTMDSLKYFSEIRKRNGTALPTALRAPPPKTSTGLGLGDYGSDEED
ncbi:pre-mRNA-splicing factor CWC2 [Gymnopus androsaceus JB14]|uniref:Pre-mRNA-splicing factor CWC2 n=1 Tax=Gymnopus androsaceus JB14 TaxID=1447944 RepID=A0A6A4HE23_9AGAR|nr:pre-mRNA-splicing factor CWC2 [Gymnopus androsaceus JB14]